MVFNMITASDRESTVKVSIPRQLHMAILKVQVVNDLDWDAACAKVADLLDSNSQEFENAVQKEAQRIYKSRHMVELNKARESISVQCHNKGYDLAMKTDHFAVPCKICKKPMQFSSLDENWVSKERLTLYAAFKDRNHTSCSSE